MPRAVCVFTAVPCVSLDFWTFEYGVSRLRGNTWASGGPQELSTGCATVESEVVAEVALATPTMQAVQTRDSWKGPPARVCVFITAGPIIKL